ncbi:MAG: thioesterase family protein [Alphaproteobacteria bacterium]|nr:MAG: thioesterase family protein [Alphaproteobacteria bacterium]
MSVSELIEPITGKSGAVSLSAASSWRQGRTMYGGATALIAYTHAIRAFPDLPPLRAAQIGFVAPVSEEVELTAQIMRQGRNVIQVRSEIHCDGGLALTAFMLFGTEREPNALYPGSPPQPMPGPPESYEEMDLGKSLTFLSHNYEMRKAQDVSGPGEPIVRRWFRLKERNVLDPISTIILLGDTMPPGAMRTLQRRGPISSINWSINLLDPAPTTRDGWWLGETRSDGADHGYSSERLSMWNTDGVQAASGLQSVAIFG